MLSRVAARPKPIALVSTFAAGAAKHAYAGGLASYTRNLAGALAENGIEPFVVADRLTLDQPGRLTASDGIQVGRCWAKGPRYILDILACLRHTRPRLVHFQHEFFLYGGTLTAILFPVLIALVRLLVRSRVIVTVHGVVPLRGAAFLSEYRREGSNRIVARLGLWLITRSITFVSDRTIVHEEQLKTVLRRDYGVPESKVVVVPHGIEQRGDRLDQAQAKERLGIDPSRQVVLFNGYLTAYKGLPFLLETFRTLAAEHKNWYLLVAAGRDPKMVNNSRYEEYYEQCKEIGALLPPDQYRWDGFVPDEALNRYFCAADVVVFPYTSGLASSGILSLALSYGRPVAVSRPLASTLPFSVPTFGFNPMDLENTLTSVLDKNEPGSEERWEELRNARSWKSIGRQTAALYAELLGNPSSVDS